MQNSRWKEIKEVEEITSHHTRTFGFTDASNERERERTGTVVVLEYNHGTNTLLANLKSSANSHVSYCLNYLSNITAP